LRFEVRMSRPVSSLALVLAVAACTTSPLGRQQLALFSEADMVRMGATAYSEMQGQIPVESDARVTGYVRCVASAVAAAAGPQQGTQWEVTVFRDESANAFALPGGKIGVHTGLLDVAKGQDQLATVIGHEVAHVLARHANERVSTNAVAQTGLQAVQILAGATSPAKQQLFGLLGVGAQVGVLLPFSRAQETEADLLGLDLMARAGFDPRASVPLWQNMAASGGGGTPEFLSTHPTHGSRIANLQNRIPQALPLYEQARAAGRQPRCG
jgi:predicted Zn-dependent protease